jgi:hypothetical protein
MPSHSPQLCRGCSIAPESYVEVAVSLQRVMSRLQYHFRELCRGCSITSESYVEVAVSLQRVTLRPYFAVFRILVCGFRADGQILVSVATKAVSKGSPNVNVVLVTEDSGGTCRYNSRHLYAMLCQRQMAVQLRKELEGSVVWSLDLILSQGWANSGPRATCDPLRVFLWPAKTVR